MNKNFLLGGTILVLVVSVILTMKFLNNFEDNLDKEAIEKANNQIITENKPLTQEKSSFKDTLKEETDKNEALIEEAPAEVKEVSENEKEEVIINNEESEEKEWSTFDKKEEPIKLEPIIVTPDNSTSEETSEETSESVNENITNTEESNVENKNE